MKRRNFLYAKKVCGQPQKIGRCSSYFLGLKQPFQKAPVLLFRTVDGKLVYFSSYFLGRIYIYTMYDALFKIEFLFQKVLRNRPLERGIKNAYRQN